jgi:hypothetical protein
VSSNPVKYRDPSGKAAAGEYGSIGVVTTAGLVGTGAGYVGRTITRQVAQEIVASGVGGLPGVAGGISCILYELQAALNVASTGAGIGSLGGCDAVPSKASDPPADGAAGPGVGAGAGSAAKAADMPPPPPRKRCYKIAEKSDKWPGVLKGHVQCAYACKTDSGMHNIVRQFPYPPGCPDETDWVDSNIH